MKKNLPLIFFLLFFCSAVIFAQSEIKITSGYLEIRYDDSIALPDPPQINTSFNFAGNQFSAVGSDTKTGSTPFINRAPRPQTDFSAAFIPLTNGRATATVGSQTFTNFYLSNPHSQTPTNFTFDSEIFVPKIVVNQNMIGSQSTFTMQGRFSCFSNLDNPPDQLCNLNVSGIGTVYYTFLRRKNFSGRWRNSVYLSKVRYEFQNQ